MAGHGLHRSFDRNLRAFSLEGFLTHRQLLDSFPADGITEARPRRNGDRPICTDFDFRIDNVFLPVAPARGDIPRQGEAGQCGHRDVVRAANSGFQHPPTPNGNAVLAASFLYAPRLTVAADPAKLDVDNAASP